LARAAVVVVVVPTNRRSFSQRVNLASVKASPLARLDRVLAKARSPAARRRGLQATLAVSPRLDRCCISAEAAVAKAARYRPQVVAALAAALAITSQAITVPQA
jgi:hypothetical protein